MTPMGLEGGSMGQQAAEVQKILDRHKIKYIVHSQAVDIEGEWDELRPLIEECHQAVHKMGAPRIRSSLVIDTRTDKENTCEAKMQAVMAACGKVTGGKTADAQGPPSSKKARIDEKAAKEE